METFMLYKDDIKIGIMRSQLPRVGDYLCYDDKAFIVKQVILSYGDKKVDGIRYLNAIMVNV